MHKIGQRIKERRKELDMTADELGRRIGKNRATVYRYENGDIENLPIDVLKPIAKALDIAPQYLMGWTIEDVEKNSDILSDITIKMGDNPTFAEVVRKLYFDDSFLSLVDTLRYLNDKQLDSIRAMLKTFFE